MMVLFKRVAIVGVGLIGGSLAAAMKARGVATSVLGIDRNPDNLAQALALGLIDEAANEMAAVAQADLIVLCAPVAQTHGLLSAIKSHIGQHCIVTDVGSTKQDVVATAKAVLGGE